MQRLAGNETKTYLWAQCGHIRCRLIRQQHIELARSILRHARTLQREAVRQLIHAVRTVHIDESLPTDGHFGIHNKDALFDGQNPVGSGRVVDDNGISGHGNDGNATGGVDINIA